MADLFPPTGRELAEKGIRESHEHAERVSEEWTRRAVAKVEEYASLNGEFMTEDVRPWAYENGLDEAPVEGSWGQVMRSAAARGIIHRAGSREAKSPGQHGKKMAVWRRGPEFLAKPKPTDSDVLEMAARMDRFSEQMRKEGRAILAEQLTDCGMMLRELVA